MEKKEQKQTNHTIALDNQKRIKITGVYEVVSATPSQIAAKTECGNLVINGSSLHITLLDEQNRIVEAEGTIFELKYNAGKKSFFQKVFK